MAQSTYPLDRILDRYPDIIATLDQQITGPAFFQIFQQLSDNYSPTLTVSRVQGPLVEQIMAAGADADRVQVNRNAQRSGTITVKIGNGQPALWLSAHSDICSYLTGVWDGSGYPLTPFCMHRAATGKRTAAVALDAPYGEGPLERLVEGEIVTLATGATRFECARDDLPLWTRVVHHLAASWDQASDHVTGFLDNQAGSAAMLLVAQTLSRFDVDALFLLNDEEEGPVDMGNQGFSRAANRLLHRTPLDQMPNYIVVTDGHTQEAALDRGDASAFGAGASYSGSTAGARGGVTPPQIVAFTRELAGWMQPHGIQLREHTGYMGRSDDISALQFTPNVSLIGYPNSYAHFSKTPLSHMSDLVNLTKTLALITLAAQAPEWQRAYL